MPPLKIFSALTNSWLGRLWQRYVIWQAGDALPARGERLFSRLDLGITCLLAGLGFGLSLYWQPRVAPPPDSHYGDNTWFQCDAAVVHQAMTSLHRLERVRRHPLEKLAMTGPVFVLHRLGMPKETACRGVIAGLAAAWTAGLFLCARIFSLSRGGAVLVTLAGTTSAAACVWMGVTETFTAGGATLLGVIIVHAAYRHTRRIGLLVAAQALALSITVTNWMIGIAAAVLSLRPRQAVQVVTNGFVCATLLWMLQARFVPQPPFFLEQEAWNQGYLFHPDAGTLGDKLRVIGLHSVVMPEATLTVVSHAPSIRYVTIQRAAWWSGDAWAIAAKVLWCGLLTCGLVTLCRRPWSSSHALLVLGLGGQVLLHSVYGDETFLYAMHWTGLLLLVAGQGLLSSYRRWVAVALGVFIVVNTVHNFAAMQHAIALANRIYLGSAP